MKFFNRTQELSLLREIREKSLDNAQLTVITGRRRVGKTQLIKAALGDRTYLYLYWGDRPYLYSVAPLR